MDKGTLYQLRNLINRRNVVSDPTDNLSACEEFFLLVVEGHLISAALTLFGMETLEDKPSVKFFPTSSASLPPTERAQILRIACSQFVKSYVDMTFGKKKDGDSTGTGIEESDGVCSYACDVLNLGLFYMEFVDAVREGDGDRIIRCWRYLLLIFKSSGRKNYSVEAFTVLCQYSFLFTPRMAAQLKWSRTVNVHGRAAKNISSDLHMEHLNRECKTAIAGMGSNVTDAAIVRVGKAIGPLSETMTSFDKHYKVPSDSGKHSTRSSKKDLDEIVKQLSNSKVFTRSAGRVHKNFPKHKTNVMSSIDMNKFKKWMNKRLQKLLVYS